MTSYLNDFSALQMNREPIQISKFDLHIIFANEEQEILYRREDSERGCTKAQHRLGALLMIQKNNINVLYEAYKWLFIAVALGNENARNDLSQVNSLLGVDEIDPGFDMAMEWFSEKFDDSLERQEEEWSMELLRWRFAEKCVH
jgi:TPR repeat protein